MYLLKREDYENDSVTKGLEEFNRYWLELCDRMAGTFHMDSSMAQWLKEKDVARLIAATPFLANSHNPKQTAASHLSIYLLSVSESTKSIFHHNEWSDDFNIMNRLKPIGNFDGGDKSIIDRGMNLLALNMICGYERDLQKDEKLKKYNPISSGVWNFEKMKNKLIHDIDTNPCPEMDEIFSMDVGIQTFWGYSEY